LEDAVILLTKGTLLLVDGATHNVAHLVHAEEHLARLRVYALPQRRGEIGLQRAGTCIVRRERWQKAELLGADPCSECLRCCLLAGDSIIAARCGEHMLLFSACCGLSRGRLRASIASGSRGGTREWDPAPP